MKYRLYMVNFGYFLDAEFASLEAAREAARGVGFEVSIMTRQAGEYQVVGAYSPIGGYRGFE